MNKSENPQLMMDDTIFELQDLHLQIKSLIRENDQLAQYAHILSHDLRAPLRHISNLATMIALDPNSQIGSHSQNLLTKLRKESESIATLVLCLREISLGNLADLPRETTDSKAILHEVLSYHQEEIHNCDIEIEIQQLPIISANPQLIRQLFDNLIRNALIHGKRPLKIEIYSESITGGTLFYFDNNDDNPNPLSRNIFEFSPDGRHEGESTGIGLHICKKIVTLHGGEITANRANNRFQVQFTIEESFSNARDQD